MHPSGCSPVRVRSCRTGCGVEPTRRDSSRATPSHRSRRSGGRGLDTRGHLHHSAVAPPRVDDSADLVVGVLHRRAEDFHPTGTDQLVGLRSARRTAGSPPASARVSSRPSGHDPRDPFDAPRCAPATRRSPHRTCRLLSRTHSMVRSAMSASRWYPSFPAFSALAPACCFPTAAGATGSHPDRRSHRRTRHPCRPASDRTGRPR